MAKAKTSFSTIKTLLNDGISQSKIAKALGVSRQYVHYVSKCERKADWRQVLDEACKDSDFQFLSIEMMRRKYFPKLSYQAFWARHKVWKKERGL